MIPGKFGIGQSVRRMEDDPLLRGVGRYVADHLPPGCLHAVVVRAPHAHARFRLDSAASRIMPGVRLVLTGKDVAGIGPLPCDVDLPGVKIFVPPYPVLVADEVRHVGDAVAFVVGDTVGQAKDAAEAIRIDWQPLPHLVGAQAALAEDAPAVWPQRPNNVAFEASIGDRRATEKAFAKATHVVSLRLVNQRLVANYLDTRGVVAEYDPAADRLTLTLSSQGSHAVRDALCTMLKLPPKKLRVVTPDVGGAFGSKLFCYREYALAAYAARYLRRSVRWIAERSEHFLGDAQGRDNVTAAKLALDAQGKFLALDVDLVADMGAYLSMYAPFIPYIGAGMAPGVYDIPACHVRVRGVFTNSVPVDAYRGAGRPEAAYVIERLVDVAARELGIAPDELRRRNFIAPRAMPYRTATDKVYDSGDFAAHLSRAQEIADWNGFERRLAEAKARGMLRGIGVASYIESCGNNGPDRAMIRLEKDGSITALMGSQSSGQGHATAYAQIIAEHLDVRPERVRVVQGDTDVIAEGTGTGGSSSIPCGGASLAGASRKLAVQLKRLAAEALEASVGDLEFFDGGICVSGTDRAISLAELARHPKATVEGLQATDAFTPSAATFPNGTHLAEVEIDPETGAVQIVNYVVVDDFGVTLNPLLLAGQVQGGTAQGIGQALLEQAVYDPASGQLVTASLLDYALPRAENIPAILFETRNLPCRSNPLGVKGAGEAGAIGSCPAVINAVVDALWRAYRVKHIDMPATPERVWAAIHDARRLHML
ncbi:MAG TPA: xanthine dehydrogenase family protein molybdopterin-binding subunit [Xanthobacteraceae bacterium]|nr:xanthine dehydrogenase family protein molybdopterin-binding subunit [Xanthobacteraceae bacterium]